MRREFLRLNHITKSFAGARALTDVTLGIEEGKICCLAGENGSGKSTLIKIIAGVHEPDSGEIIIRGKPYRRLHPIESIRQGVQVIYQDLALFPNLSVAENAALNREISRKRIWVRWREVEEIARGALGRIGVELDPWAQLGNLPFADRQLVAIARALLHDARLIIMDEATAALTRREIRSLFSAIRELKREGISILFVSHKLDEVLELADRAIVLRNGEKVLDREADGLDRAGMVCAITGRTIEPETSGPGGMLPISPVLLKVEDLSCDRCFRDVSFELRSGEILGITGLRGSGRTALALSLFGMLPAGSGTVSVEGRTVGTGIREALRNRIAYIPEDRLNEGLFLDQSVGRNIAVCIIDSLRGRMRLLDRKRVRARVREWMERLRIRTPSSDLPASSLSGGNQQRVVLARWLASDPRILILNGPTVGVDVGSKMEIHEIMRGLARRGMGLLVISDDIPELLQLCHRILLMKRGRIAEEFDRQSITESELNNILASA